MTSAAEARGIALAAQGFGASRPVGPSKARILAEVRRLGVLQIDSVNVLARAHYLPIFARLGCYDRARLDALAWGQRPALFEYWCHQASFAPVELPRYVGRMIYAHRGASFELPDNTLESFALALEVGADALETDAHMTRDGHVVLSHDPTGGGASRAIAEASFSEVRRWDVGEKFEPRRPGKFVPGVPYEMPTLEEALAAFPNVVFNVDAKQTTPDMVPALLRAVERCNASSRVRIASFSERNLRRVRARGYAGETGLSPSEVARLMFIPRAALRWYRPAGHAAQVPRRAYGIAFDSQRSIDRFHAVGLRVDFWTIDDPEEARRLIAMGADGIMTDDPRAVCAG